jgi:hypothetical protein
MIEARFLTTKVEIVLYRMSKEVIVSDILNKQFYMYTCPIPNGFRDRAISLQKSKIFDKKDITYCF